MAQFRTCQQIRGGTHSTLRVVITRVSSCCEELVTRPDGRGSRTCRRIDRHGSLSWRSSCSRVPCSSRHATAGSSGVGRWYNREAPRIRTDLNFYEVLGPLSKTVKCKLMFQHGAVEANDCCIRQPAEFIDEIANCDHGGSATALRKALLMALLLPSLTEASMVLFHLHGRGIALLRLGLVFVAQKPMRHPALN